MKIKKFEDIIAWQKGQLLSKKVYQHFRACPDFSFRNQIQRAVVSITNNIAEGFERQTNKELKQFLFIAKGSAGEVRSMLHLALSLKLLNHDMFEEMHSDTMEISKLLSGFIKALR